MHLTRILSLLALISAGAVQAQNPPAKPSREITLAEAIQMALENNLDVKIQRFNPLIAEHNLRSSYAIYEPGITLQGSHFFSSQPGGVDQFGRDIGNRELEVDTLPGINFGLGAILPTGARYSITESLSRTTSLVGTNENSNYNASWSIQLSQPLLQNFWIDPGRATILINKKVLKLSETMLKGQIMTTVHSVEQAYYNLIFARENVKVVEKALELAQRTLFENKKKVELGALAPLDEKQAEAQVAASKADLIAAQQNLAFQENVLKSLLTDKYESFHEVELIPAEKLVPVPVAFNLQDSWQRGLAMRPDLQQAKLDLERRDITLRLQKNQILPSLDVFGRYGVSGNRLNTSYGDVLSDLTRDRNPSYSFGGSLTIPLGNIGARNRYKATRAEKEQALLQLKKLEQDIMVQIDDAIKAVQSAFERVQATREAREFAFTALDAEQKKLENGKSTTFQVLQLQRNLTAASFEEIRALAEYNNAQALHAFREGSTLDRHRLNLNLQR
ncbi:MAG: TolC family protein [Verrucomicrobia bacterium]|nr:TolC family protein [Verrucomicrobiota bacterium]